ncbi:hypothetical protein BDR04DRAFT_1180945 [Suillus decipiens]|nr:hypothetical protein BDR04DRAFT_1180945 [Suillus decipiens]
MSYPLDSEASNEADGMKYRFETELTNGCHEEAFIETRSMLPELRTILEAIVGHECFAKSSLWPKADGKTPGEYGEFPALGLGGRSNAASHEEIQQHQYPALFHKQRWYWGKDESYQGIVHGSAPKRLKVSVARRSRPRTKPDEIGMSHLFSMALIRSIFPFSPLPPIPQQSEGICPVPHLSTATAHIEMLEYQLSGTFGNDGAILLNVGSLVLPFGVGRHRYFTVQVCYAFVYGFPVQLS